MPGGAMHRNTHIAGDNNFMRAFVSILIPAYNAGNWIADTLESAIAQTWPHKEIIVVGDGSTDGTLPIARRFDSDRSAPPA